MSSRNIVDLASERTQRRNLTRQAVEGAESLVEGLQLAGRSLANLAWALAAPIRHYDKELKEGIYELVLARLHKIISGAIEDMNQAPEIRRQAQEQATKAAFAAFQMHLLILAAAERDGKPET